MHCIYARADWKDYMMSDTKYCANCKYHLQLDKDGFRDPRYHKCEYKQENSLIKIDIISNQFPMVTCQEMRNGECGPEAKLFKAK